MIGRVSGELGKANIEGLECILGGKLGEEDEIAFGAADEIEMIGTNSPHVVGSCAEQSHMPGDGWTAANGAVSVKPGLEGSGNPAFDPGEKIPRQVSRQSNCRVHSNIEVPLCIGVPVSRPGWMYQSAS